MVGTEGEVGAETTDALVASAEQQHNNVTRLMLYLNTLSRRLWLYPWVVLQTGLWKTFLVCLVNPGFTIIMHRCSIR